MVNPPVQAPASPPAGMCVGVGGGGSTAVPAPSRGLATAPVPAPFLRAPHGCQLSEVARMERWKILWRAKV